MTPLPTAERAALLELFPIKLVGGFITVDQHVGCVGCRFCLSRRHPLWQQVYASGYHAGHGFESPAQAAALLGSMRPLSEARVPVRFGHNTDSHYQWDFGAALFRQLPAESPFIFMTRFPVPEAQRRWIDGQPNLLVKVTITPPSRALAVQTDVAAILESIAALPRQNLYLLVGPLVPDNLAGAAAVLDALPPGTWADVKRLTRAGIPPVRDLAIPTGEALAELRRRAVRRGLVMTDFFGCLTRRALGRTFYKYDAAVGYIGDTCATCPRESECARVPAREAAQAAARDLAASIGLTLGAVRWDGPRTARFQCAEPSSRGDETFLS